VLFPPFGRLKGFPIGGKSTRRAMPVKRWSDPLKIEAERKAYHARLARDVQASEVR
jgi:hypothetical protein